MHRFFNISLDFNKSMDCLYNNQKLIKRKTQKRERKDFSWKINERERKNKSRTIFYWVEKEISIEQ